MKSITILIHSFLFSILLLNTIGSTTYAQCNCDTLTTVMDTTLESANRNAKAQIDQLMTRPDMTQINNCLTSIRGGLSAFFTLNLPSIESILDGICEAAMDFVYDAATSYLDNALGNIGGGANWWQFFSIDWGGNFGLNQTNGDSLWAIEGDIVTFNVNQTDVDLSGSIQDLFN